MEIFVTRPRADLTAVAELITTGQSVLASTGGWVIRLRAADVNVNPILNEMPIAPVSISVAKIRARRAGQTPIATFK